MEQGSKEWLDWRRQGIGASESAALLGLCPYKTARQLWNEKLTGSKDEGNATLFRKGHETEAAVRARLELTSGLEYPPALFEHPEFPFIRASLDGWCKDAEPGKRGMEIKYVGKDVNTIKPHHLIQVQHQMLVTGEPAWTYVMCHEGAPMVMTIKEDLGLQSKILSACWKFWDEIQRKAEPDAQARDWVPDHRSEMIAAVEDMREAKTTKARNEARERVLELARHPRSVCNGVKISIDPARVTFPKPGGADVPND